MKQTQYELDRLEEQHYTNLFNLYNREIEETIEEEEEEIETVENYIVWNKEIESTVMYCESIEEAERIANAMNKATGTNNFEAYFEIW